MILAFPYVKEGHLEAQERMYHPALSYRCHPSCSACVTWTTIISGEINSTVTWSLVHAFCHSFLQGYALLPGTYFSVKNNTSSLTP